MTSSRLDALRTLKWSNADVAFATAFNTLVSGTFLIGFIQHLGGSDLWIQVIVALPSFMGLFQIPGAIWGRRYPFFKKFVTPGGWAWRLLYVPLIALPLLPWPAETKLWVMAGCVLLATTANQIVGPIYSDWIAGLVPAESRGWFFSRRTSLATAVGMGIAFLGALLLDNLRSHGKSEQAFSIIFGLGFICALASMASYLQMKDTVRENTVQAGVRESLKLMAKPARDRDFQKVLVFTIVFMVSATLAGGLYVAFARETLGLSYTVIQLTQVAHAIGTVATVNVWGYLADKYGNKPMLVILVAGVLLTPVIWLFCTPGHMVQNATVLVVGHLFNGAVWSGVAVCQLNLYIATSKSEDRPNYLGMVLAVQAVTGGIAPLVGGVAMNAFRASMSAEMAYKLIFVSVMVIRVLALLTLLPVKEEGSVAVSQTLGQLGKINPRGIRALRRLSRTGDAATKAEAIKDVGKSQMPLAASELMRALVDPSPPVRRQASRALAKISDPESAKALAQFVRDHRELVEEETLEALGDMGDPGAVEVVTPYLSDPRSLLRRQAAKALGRLGSAEAVGPLETAAKDPNDSGLRRAAVQALRILESKGSWPVIGVALHDPTPSVREAAAETVSELGLDALVADVRDAITVYGDSYSSELAYALGVVGTVEDLSIVLWCAEQSASATSRRRCLLGAARILGVESPLYKLFNLSGLSRDQELILALRPAYQKSKRLREAVQTYSLGRETEAVALLSTSKVAKELAVFARHEISESFLVVALAYSKHC